MRSKLNELNELNEIPSELTKLTELNHIAVSHVSPVSSTTHLPGLYIHTYVRLNVLLSAIYVVLRVLSSTQVLLLHVSTSPTTGASNFSSRIDGSFVLAPNIAQAALQSAPSSINKFMTSIHAVSSNMQQHRLPSYQ